MARGSRARVADAGGRSNLALRLLTAAVTVPFIFYLLYWAPRWAFPCVAATTCALGAYELFAMVAPEHRLLRVFGIGASLAMFALTLLPQAKPFMAPGVVALTGAGMLIALRAPQPIEQAAARMGWAVAGPLYMGALFGALADLYWHANGGSWVLLALICGFLSDTAGYFVGRRFGRHKLNELVSPKKTIEGSIGGLAGGVLGALIAHFTILPELGLLPAIALSLVATALGQAGDLCESLIKRSVGVKDSGTILPGHGGILDRSDAMLFSAAAVWLYVTFLA